MKPISTILLASVFAFFALACNQNTGQTREKAAETTAQIKQEAKKAGAELRKDTEEARRQGKAVAEGVREGWKEGDKAIDINSASKAQLMSLPGINARTAGQIISGRPYSDKDELVSRKIISQSEYQNIEARITAK